LLQEIEEEFEGDDDDEDVSYASKGGLPSSLVESKTSFSIFDFTLIQRGCM
jgi:hypothetical protein